MSNPNPRGNRFADLETLPVRFTLDGEPFRGFDPERFKLVETQTTTEGEKVKTVSTLDAGGNLSITVETARYPNYGAHEWAVWFRNTGNGNTPVIGDLKSADLFFEGENPVLRGILGDHQNQYRPYAHNLLDGPVDHLSTTGKPTHIYFPYYNLEHGGGGTLLAIGWGGTWEANFSAVENNRARLTATATNGLRTYLKPGESIRTARVVAIPYAGRDEDLATNLWRRWFVNCNMPRANAAGDPVKPFRTIFLAVDTGLPNSDGSISERHFTWRPSLEKMLAENIRADFRWLDAGWYFDPWGKTVETDWWGTIGSWELDTVKWPGGSLRESTDFARQHGMKTLAWFEPERVTHVDGLVANHGYKCEWALRDGNLVVNNIGNPECLDWTAGRIIAMMEKHGVDMYREDNNCYPGECWAKAALAEGADRAGIVENKAVAAHYELWDRVLAHCAKTGGATFADSCASGGGRNDLESMRRGVPLLRSDSDRTTTSLRLSMTTSFNKWIPFCGASTLEQAGQLDLDGKRDPYITRASLNPVFNLAAQWTQNPATDFELIRAGLREWDSVKEFLLKDFYVLTEWRPEADRSGWTGFMYFDPETEKGALFAFRMEECAEPERALSLRMLDPAAEYELRDADTGAAVRRAGSELVAGHVFRHAAPRTASLVFVSRVK